MSQLKSDFNLGPAPGLSRYWVWEPRVTDEADAIEVESSSAEAAALHIAKTVFDDGDHFDSIELTVKSAMLRESFRVSVTLNPKFLAVRTKSAPRFGHAKNARVRA